MFEYYPINTSGHKLFDSGIDTRTSLLIQGLSPLHVLPLDVIYDSNIVGCNFRVLPFWNREKFKGSDNTVTINRQASIALKYQAILHECLVLCVSVIIHYLITWVITHIAYLTNMHILYMFQLNIDLRI